MVVLSRDKDYGWNVRMRNLPLFRFGDRGSAIRFVESVWAYIQNP